MTKAGYGSLCLLLVLTTAQCVLGQIGHTSVHNSASFDITREKYLTHLDGTETIINQSTLTQGTTEEFEVPADVRCIRTLYYRLPAEKFGLQVVLDWCKTGMPIYCLPDCFWTVDDTGFSVADFQFGTPRLVAAWEPVSY